MKVLVTGATGLVGKAICKTLSEKNISVRVLVRETNSNKQEFLNAGFEIAEGDVTDILSLYKALEGVDMVIHSAAVVSFVPKDRPNMYKINVEGTANLVNACLENKIKKFLHISSVASLGRPPIETMPKDQWCIINESQKWEESDTNSHYAKTKYLSENEVWRGMAEGLNVVVVNPSIILGEGDWNRSSSQILKYVYQQKPFYTAGFINYVDVQDVANISVQLLLSDISGERFCLSADSISYLELFSSIANNFGKKKPSIKIGKFLLGVLWRLESIRSRLFGSSPLITKETALTSQLRIKYDSTKIKETLHYNFNSLDKTLDRVCKYYLDIT
jgi:nucleoside-diphosphate-sugar epimerase